MTTPRVSALRIGEHVEFAGMPYVFAALLHGEVAELRSGGEAPVHILISALVTDPTFKPAPDQSRQGRLGESEIFAALPDTVKTRAYWLERHVTEVLDGIPADANPGERSRREYDVTSRSMRQRLLAKEEELKTLGEDLSLTTLKRLAAAYQTDGVQGLVDERIITGWQNVPHDGLRDPLTPRRVLNPNEKYAALLSVAV